MSHILKVHWHIYVYNHWDLYALWIPTKSIVFYKVMVCHWASLASHFRNYLVSAFCHLNQDLITIGRHLPGEKSPILIISWVVQWVSCLAVFYFWLTSDLHLVMGCRQCEIPRFLHLVFGWQQWEIPRFLSQQHSFFQRKSGWM